MLTAKNGFQILNLHPKKLYFKNKSTRLFNAYKVKKFFLLNWDLCFLLFFQFQIAFCLIIKTLLVHNYFKISCITLMQLLRKSLRVEIQIMNSFFLRNLSI